jgi:ubiquinone/menaquinone biosynthesis C-methylase UbiE
MVADNIGMAAQLARQSLRAGWYFGLTRVMEQLVARHGGRRKTGRRRSPSPSLQELLADLGALIMRDALAVREGLYPPTEDEPRSAFEHLSRVQAMLADLPATLDRQNRRDFASVHRDADARGVPEYFAQDFHFQSGGYLSPQSARLYDVQVETLFMGAAGAMRRAALQPIAAHMRGRDQRCMRLLDVACGTGRFLRNLRQAYPALTMAGIDLSSAYLGEARRHLHGLRPVSLLVANAEAMPFATGSQDIVTAVFLFHELPADVRRTISAEIARVLKPGGLFVLVDSLQLGDRPGWDGLLEAFPDRFHEPYYEHYLTHDLDTMLTSAGLQPESTETAFLAKIMARRKV